MAVFECDEYSSMINTDNARLFTLSVFILDYCQLFWPVVNGQCYRNVKMAIYDILLLTSGLFNQDGGLFYLQPANHPKGKVTIVGLQYSKP